MRERKKEDAVIPAGVLMIDVKQVAAKCGLGVSTVWKLAKDESSGFPKPIRLNARCARWRDSVFSTTIEIFSIIALRLYLSLYHTAKATENTNRKQSLHYLC